MSQRSCDLCQNTAIIHETVTRASVVKVRHLCRVHGLKMWRAALPVDGKAPKPLAKKPVFHSLGADAGELLQRRGDSQPPR